MEYFIENSLLVSDLDSLEYTLMYENTKLDNNNQGIVTKIINKIKEIWQNIKKYFTSQKTNSQIDKIKKSSSNIKTYENVMKKKDPEKLKDEEKKIQDKSIFKGIHIKDYIDSFKEFFKYNLNCIKKKNFRAVLPLSYFLSKKQKRTAKIAAGLSVIVSTFVNAVLQYKGMTIQNDGMLAVEELEKRVSKKIKDASFKKGVMSAEKSHLKEMKKERNASKDQIRQEKNISKERVEKIMFDREHPDGIIDIDLDAEKNSALILKAAISEFNSLGATLGAGLNIILGLCGRSNEVALQTAAIEAGAVSKSKINKAFKNRRATKTLNDANIEYNMGRATARSEIFKDENIGV